MEVDNDDDELETPVESGSTRRQREEEGGGEESRNGKRTAVDASLPQPRNREKFQAFVAALKAQCKANNMRSLGNEDLPLLRELFKYASMEASEEPFPVDPLRLLGGEEGEQEGQEGEGGAQGCRRPDPLGLRHSGVPVDVPPSGANSIL